MRTFLHPGERVRVLARALAPATALTAVLVALGAPTSGAATSNTVVGATVPTATVVGLLGCAPRAAGVTDFGPVTAGSSTVTPSDCVVTFGSSNSGAQLMMRQTDGRGDAMWRPTDGAVAAAYGGGDGRFRDGALTVNDAMSNGVSGGVDGDVAGNVLVAGRVGTDAVIRRYLPTGAIDPSFGTAGTATFSNCTMTPISLEVLDGGGVVSTGEYTGCGTGVWAARTLANGQPDPAFGGGDGFATRVVAIDVRAAVVDSAGGVLLAGGSVSTIEVVRFSPDGSADMTFAGDGLADPALAAGAEEGRGIALQPDGKILVTGYKTNVDTDIFVARLTATGGLDTTTFGAGTGEVQFNDAINNQGRDVVVADDGSVFAVGYAAQSGWIAKATSAGVVDTTFGTSGILRLDFAGDEGFHAIELQPGNKLIAAGYTDRGVSEDAWFTRVTTAGALDTTFGTGGHLRLDVETTVNGVNHAAFVDDGDLLATGPSTDRASVIRLDGSTVGWRSLPS